MEKKSPNSKNDLGAFRTVGDSTDSRATDPEKKIHPASNITVRDAPSSVFMVIIGVAFKTQIRNKLQHQHIGALIIGLKPLIDKVQHP